MALLKNLEIPEFYDRFDPVSLALDSPNFLDRETRVFYLEFFIYIFKLIFLVLIEIAYKQFGFSNSSVA